MSRPPTFANNADMRQAILARLQVGPCDNKTLTSALHVRNSKVGPQMEHLEALNQVHRVEGSRGSYQWHIGPGQRQELPSLDKPGRRGSGLKVRQITRSTYPDNQFMRPEFETYLHGPAARRKA